MSENNGKTTNKNKKTTMFINEDNTKPITAAGVIIYKKVNNKMKLLMAESRNRYEDIGGKIDPIDESIYHAAAREIEEETNHIIKSDDIIDRLKSANYVYVPNSKYIIFIVEANAEEKKLKKEDFGKMELHDNLSRTIGWLDKEILLNSFIIKYKMNPRIKYKTLFDKLAIIDSQYKYKKNMFKKSK